MIIFFSIMCFCMGFSLAAMIYNNKKPKNTEFIKGYPQGYIPRN